MIFLIPPSEGKTPALNGRPLNLKNLPFPELSSKRNEAIDALVALTTVTPEIASQALGLGPSQQDLLKMNKGIRSSPCAPAVEIYSGVLFDHFDYKSLSPRGKKIANDSILIASALFGFVYPNSLIPSYRFSGSTVLPGIGPLSNFWKPELPALLSNLAHELALAHELVVDMRSGSYTKLAPLPHQKNTTENAMENTIENTIELRVMTLIKGVRKSVTHFNKATKGDVIRASMSSTKKFPSRISDVGNYFRSLGFDAELEENHVGRTELIILTA